MEISAICTQSRIRYTIGQQLGVGPMGALCFATVMVPTTYIQGQTCHAWCLYPSSCRVTCPPGTHLNRQQVHSVIFWPQQPVSQLHYGFISEFLWPWPCLCLFATPGRAHCMAAVGGGGGLTGIAWMVHDVAAQIPVITAIPDGNIPFGSTPHAGQARCTTHGSTWQQPQVHTYTRKHTHTCAPLHTHTYACTRATRART